MYITRVELTDVKCFKNLELNMLGPEERPMRWVTLLGENGTGKSTLLQALGAVLVGPAATRELLPVAEGWLRKGASFGEIQVDMWPDREDAKPLHRPRKASPYKARFVVTGVSKDGLPEALAERHQGVPMVIQFAGHSEPNTQKRWQKDAKSLRQTAYDEARAGWLACGYGPFRRLSGGSPDAAGILGSGRTAARMVTLFREDAALTSATRWLKELHNLARDGDEASGRSLEIVKEAFRKNLMPDSVELEVDAKGVSLRVDGRAAIGIAQLSDGYRSMLALAIDLIRWLMSAFPEQDDPLLCPGVVLIDELDAHLHPTWQRRIGVWLQEKFPRLQFIVATHSPFLAQVAPAGGNIVLRGTEQGTVADSDPKSVSAWQINEILEDLFGLETTISPQAELKLKRLEFLLKEAKQRKLPTALAEELEELKSWQLQQPLPLVDPAHRRVAEVLRKAADKFDSALKELE